MESGSNVYNLGVGVGACVFFCLGAAVWGGRAHFEIARLGFIMNRVVPMGDKFKSQLKDLCHE
eukprot:3648166-Amphidinium_carterae.1